MIRIIILSVLILGCKSVPKLALNEGKPTSEEKTIDGFVLNGIVTHEESELPIGNAKVEIANTSKRVYTNQNGEFTFRDIDKGFSTVLVKADGFRSSRKSILFEDLEKTSGPNALIKEISIPLRPEEEELIPEPYGVDTLLTSLLSYSGELLNSIDSLKNIRYEVNNRISENIRSLMMEERSDPFFKPFRDLFITSNANRCSALSWSDDAFNEIRGGLPEMQLKDPISFSVFNYDTGYIIEVFLNNFRSMDDGLGVRYRYDMDLFFRTIMTTNSDLISMWDKNRRKLYVGSSRHFLTNLAEGKHVSAGYRVYGGQYSEANNSSLGSAVIFSGDIEIGPEAFFRKDPATNSFYLESNRELKVEYLNQFMGRGYDYKGLNELRYQTSWIKLNNQKVYFSEDGTLKDSQSVVLNGFWGFQKICDMLPEDYVP